MQDTQNRKTEETKKEKLNAMHAKINNQKECMKAIKTAWSRMHMSMHEPQS